MTHRNEDLRTYSFEISSLDRNDNEHIGWFINDELATKVYLLMWPTVQTVSDMNGQQVPLPLSEIRSPEDIVSVDGLFIQKENLRKAVADLGISKEYLIDKARFMRATGTGRLNVDPNMHFICSTGLREQPVALIINRDFLRRHADWTPFTVTQDEIIYKDLFKDKQENRFRSQNVRNRPRRAYDKNKQNKGVCL